MTEPPLSGADAAGRPEPASDAPASPPPPAPLPPLRLTDLTLASPFRWLGRGTRDLIAAWPQSLFFGACFWMMALLIKRVFLGSPEYTLTIISGCFLVGPFLAMGLYDISRRRGAGVAQDFGSSLTCWTGQMSGMALLVLVLLVLELLWGRASLVVFALFFNTGMPSTSSVVDAVFNPSNLEFVIAYLLVGGFFAGLVYATCAISIPMILDRDTDAVTAGIKSIQLVLGRPGVMLLWGALIVMLMLAAFASPWSVATLFIVSILGHASWHAYRDAMPSAAPANESLTPTT